MNLNRILRLLKKSQEYLDNRGILSLAVFGSTARQENTSTSDVDILVAFKSAPTFDQYIETKFFLEDLLGCKVDLVTQDGLKPLARAEVEKEAIYVT